MTKSSIRIGFGHPADVHDLIHASAYRYGFSFSRDCVGYDLQHDFVVEVVKEDVHRPIALLHRPIALLPRSRASQSEASDMALFAMAR